MYNIVQILPSIEWGTVAISVLGSIAVSRYTINQELRAQRDYRLKREYENWIHKVISTGLKIRRNCLKMSYGEPIEFEDNPEGGHLKELDEIRDLIDELLDYHTESPPETSRELLEMIEEIGYWWDNNVNNSDITTTDIRENLLPEIVRFVDLAVEKSERYHDSPW